VDLNNLIHDFLHFNIGINFSSWSPEHKRMLHSFSISAKANNFEMHELQQGHFPDIK